MIFADMVSAKYASGIASDAKYRAGGVGDGDDVRIIAKLPDQVIANDGAHFVTSGYVFKLQVSEVATPVAGDTIEWNNAVYEVQGKPVRIGRVALEWELDMVPA